MMRPMKTFLARAAVVIALSSPQIAVAEERAPTPPPNETAADWRAERRAQCLGWLADGYPSGLEELSCRTEFDLPSPFLLVCARGLRVGFRDAAQREACAAFFANQGARIADGYVRS